VFTAQNLLSVGVAALLTAGLYAVMSYGLAIIYGVMKVINLSNAGFLMLGAFMTLVYLQAWHLDPLAGAFALIAVGVLVSRLLLKQQPIWRAIARVVFLVLLTLLLLHG